MPLEGAQRAAPQPDCIPLPQAEILMGKAFKELGWKREDIVVATKVFPWW